MFRNLSWEEYESGLLERLIWEFPPPLFSVQGTQNGKQHRIRGHASRTRRQIDAAVYRADSSKPVLVADAKRHKRLVDVAAVDAFIGFLEDIDCRLGILASPKGFTVAARRRAQAAGIELSLFTYEACLEAELLPMARAIYTQDWAFHPKIARALLALKKGADAAHECIESLEDVPYEEWLGFVAYGLKQHRDEAVELLSMIAMMHFDDGWRYNAIQQLMAVGALSPALRRTLLERERDPDTRKLLESAET